MRIVGGVLRGRKLLSPDGLATRPTSDRARESVFNILLHAKWLEADALQEADSLDVFAGTGALGLESLSRGARHCLFIENDRKAAKTCQANIDALGMEERAKLLAFDALKPPLRPEHTNPRTLAFLDPPYGKNMGSAALEALANKNWLKKGAVCVLEMDKKRPEPSPDGFAPQDERAYGIALVRFLIWQP